MFERFLGSKGIFPDKERGGGKIPLPRFSPKAQLVALLAVGVLVLSACAPAVDVDQVVQTECRGPMTIKQIRKELIPHNPQYEYTPYYGNGTREVVDFNNATCNLPDRFNPGIAKNIIVPCPDRVMTVGQFNLELTLANSSAGKNGREALSSYRNAACPANQQQS